MLIRILDLIHRIEDLLVHRIHAALVKAAGLPEPQ